MLSEEKEKIKEVSEFLSTNTDEVVVLLIVVTYLISWLILPFVNIKVVMPESVVMAALAYIFGKQSGVLRNKQG